MENIAIIGMGCSFPGASSLREFWQLLAEGRHGITRIPSDRWDADRFYDPRPSAPGKSNSCFGGFVPTLDQFDAEFFRIPEAEAARMDPQQRLFLETAYHALENAGLPIGDLAGSDTGVFVGVGHSDHEQKLRRHLGSIDRNLGVHSLHCFSANRISYHLNLLGPSLAIDTACSSSLVCVHLACQSLRARECDLALAGGVNAHLLPDESISTSLMGLLASDGLCKSFDQRADGYVRSEGCGVVVLKRLDDALAAGDCVLAVLRGSAVNHNGLSNGITAPSGLAQARVITRALRSACVKPYELGYIEAHATGTAVGDQMEMAAIQRVLGAAGERRNTSPCLVGCVKTNIGHLEAASGVAGLIKVVLALQYEELPGLLHFRQPNQALQLDDSVALVTSATPWPRRADRARIAGINAFGFGGTNCHLVVEEGPPDARPATVGGHQLITLSAKTRPALEALIRATARQLAELRGPRALTDFCFSLNTGRTALPFRCSVTGLDAHQLMMRLTTGLARMEHHGRVGRFPPKVGLVTGVGDSTAVSTLSRLTALARMTRLTTGLDLDADAERDADGLATRILERLGIHAACVLVCDVSGVGGACAALTLAMTAADREAALRGLMAERELDALIVLGSGSRVTELESAGIRLRVFCPFAGESEPLQSLQRLAGALWVQGAKLDFRHLYPGTARRVLVPNYPFQRRPSWHRVPSEPHVEQS
jgi:acyl transferase domain-containing protein